MAINCRSRNEKAWCCPVINAGPKLLTVAQNTVEMCDAINAEKLEASGSSVAIDGVSSLTHTLDVRLKSKNLIPVKAFDENNWQAIGSSQYVYVFPTALPAGTYTISGKTDTPTDCGYWYLQKMVDGERKNIVYLSRSTSHTLPYSFLLEEDTVLSFFWFGKGYKTPWNIFYEAQLEPGSTATDYVSPVVQDFTDTTVTRYGKNLLPDAAFDANNWYGTISAHYYNLTGLSPGNYVISAKYVTQADNYYGYWYINVSSDNFVTEKNAAQMCVGTYTAPKTSIAFTINAGEKARFYWYGKGDVTPFITYVRDPQIELGSTATAYEPYVEPVIYTPTADGTVSGVTSVSPSMTLMSNSTGVVINCKYFSSSADKLRAAASSCLQKLKTLRKSLGEYLKRS